MGEYASEMRVVGIVLVIFSLGLLCAALDESVEAEHTDFNEVTKIPKTDFAEVLLTQTTLKAHFESANVREKRVKKDKAFANIGISREKYRKAREKLEKAMKEKKTKEIRKKRRKSRRKPGRRKQRRGKPKKRKLRKGVPKRREPRRRKQRKARGRKRRRR